MNLKNHKKLNKWALCLAAALLGLGMQPATASLNVAYWTFPTGYNGSFVDGHSGADATPDFTTSGWSGTIIANNGEGVQFSASGGTTVNDPRATPDASERFQLISSVNNGPANNVILQLNNVSGGSLSDFIVTYAARSTSSGSSSVTWEWSTDGINYYSTDVGQASGVTGNTWVSQTADFTGVTDIDNLVAGSTIYFEATLNGTTTAFFDNIVVQAVPEPVTQALVIFASLALLVSAGRWGVCHLKQAV